MAELFWECGTRGETHIIRHKGGRYKILHNGKLTALQRQPMDIQAGYIRVFGAAAAALDVLEPLRVSAGVPEIKKACRILRQAIADTEEHTDLMP